MANAKWRESAKKNEYCGFSFIACSFISVFATAPIRCHTPLITSTIARLKYFFIFHLSLRFTSLSAFNWKLSTLEKLSFLLTQIPRKRKERFFSLPLPAHSLLFIFSSFSPMRYRRCCDVVVAVKSQPNGFFLTQFRQKVKRISDVQQGLSLLIAELNSGLKNIFFHLLTDIDICANIKHILMGFCWFHRQCCFLSVILKMMNLIQLKLSYIPFFSFARA